MTLFRTIREALETIAPAVSFVHREDAVAYLKDRISEKDEKFDGRLRKCSSANCSGLIYWRRTAAGHAAPVDLDGEPHFATCPDAEKFRRARAARAGEETES